MADKTGEKSKMEAQTLWMVRPAALGDTILTVPAFRALAAWRPELSPVAVINGAWSGLPWVQAGVADQVLDYQGPLVWQILYGQQRLDRPPPKLIAAWMGDHDGSLAERWRRELGAEVLILPFPTSATQTPPHAAHQLGVGIPGFCWRKGDRALPPFQTAVSGVTREPVAVLAPGAGAVSKCVALAVWAQLADHARAQGLAPVWLWGPAEQERRQSEPFFKDLWALLQTRQEPVWDNLPWSQLWPKLAGVTLAITHDSGPAHAAAALGVPTQVLFSTTNPQVWLPLGTSQERPIGLTSHTL